MGREDEPKVRHSVRVLLLDGHDRLLLFRGVEPETRKPFWFPAGGGLKDGEGVEDAARREIRRRPGSRSSSSVTRSDDAATSSNGAGSDGTSASVGSSRVLNPFSPTLAVTRTRRWWI
jgi:hypothetical protein